MIIIQATSQHVPVIARMAKETYVENYSQYYTGEKLEKLEAHVATYHTHEQIQADLDGGEQVFFVCEDADREGLNPLGFCQVRRKTPRQVLPELSAEYPEPCWEIRRCYVLRGNQGKNAGSLLMQAALSKVKEAGAKTMWLFVLKDNVNAQRFYQKFGLENVGHSFFYYAGTTSLFVKQVQAE
ncbi:acyl-CoA N-acyltransferase [Chytriomyces cf. hyalinus JEL632]|nr:acyl-CoA N-acyltransferase [Chytriomyces cf. hyalinus JEL632]